MSTANRNKVIQWEITFPQSGETPKDTFHSCFPPATYSICAKEAHADGNPHLHLGIKLKKGISKSNLLKFVEKRFPNDYKRIHVSPIKSWDQWIDYCHKEDADPVITGSLSQVISKVERLNRYFGKYPELWFEIGMPTAEQFLADMAEKEAHKAAALAEIENRRLAHELRRLDAM
ncbi:MAG: replication-associated protein [Cressdnaviricota sp.]|nr:MAG: replication-associated protein [Cressdnaviricota sp.]